MIENVCVLLAVTMELVGGVAAGAGVALAGGRPGAVTLAVQAFTGGGLSARATRMTASGMPTANTLVKKTETVRFLRVKTILQYPKSSSQPIL